MNIFILYFKNNEPKIDIIQEVFFGIVYMCKLTTNEDVDIHVH